MAREGRRTFGDSHRLVWSSRMTRSTSSYPFFTSPPWVVHLNDMFDVKRLRFVGRTHRLVLSTRRTLSHVAKTLWYTPHCPVFLRQSQCRKTLLVNTLPRLVSQKDLCHCARLSWCAHCPVFLETLPMSKDPVVHLSVRRACLVSKDFLVGKLTASWSSWP